MLSRFKTIFRCLSIFLVVLFLVTPIRVKASGELENISEDITFEEVEIIGKTIEKYLFVDGDRIYFDYDMALNNGESKEVLEQGLVLEEISAGLSSEYSTSKNYKISLPVWGNYCGPGYGGKDSNKPVKDILDEGCKRHDQCFKWGLGLKKNCECNRELVEYIDNHKREMRGTMAVVAWAIRTYFSTVGSVGC